MWHFFLEWRQPGLALDLCVRETLCTGLFSSTPFLLQAVLSTAPVLVPEECAHRMCSLPVWYLHPPVDGGVVPALSAVCVSQRSGGCFLTLLSPQVQAVLELASSWKLQSWA